MSMTSPFKPTTAAPASAAALPDQLDAQASPPNQSHLIELPFSLPRPHCGFTLGNGLLGVMVWGSDDQLCITINRADFWDHRRAYKLTGQDLYQQLLDLYDACSDDSLVPPFEAMIRSQMPDGQLPAEKLRNSRLPMGRFALQLRPGMILLRGQLDVTRGILHIHVGSASPDPSQVVLKILLHPAECSLRVEDQDRAIQKVHAKPSWQWVGEILQKRGYHPPLLHRQSENSIHHCGWSQAIPHDPACDPQPADPAMAAVCLHAPAHLAISMIPGDDAATALAHTVQGARQALAKDALAYEQEVAQWWQGYFRTLPRVTLPDDFFDRFLKLALFKFAASTSPASPLPCALQGPWCEEYQLPPWSADYHFNVNVQQVYTLAFPAGKADHLLPLFDMLERCLPVFREQARCMVGVDGGILITHTTDDRGLSCGGLGAASTVDHAVTGWTALLYWDYYQHTGDEAFLRDRALPFMQGAMRVYEAMIRWEEGLPTLPISISAEYGVSLPDGQKKRVGPAASYQYACLHKLGSAIRQACTTLRIDMPQAWCDLLDKLPAWTTVGLPGQERIAIWKNQDLDISHRHHSHLASIYPFDTLEHRTPQVQAVVDRSLHRWLEVGMSDWSEWSLPWAAIIQAREGYRDGPMILLNLCKAIYINQGWATVYQPRFPGVVVHGLQRLTGPLESCEIMQLDGTMGIATALYEMLVHTHRGIIRFFPATPADWRNVSFQNIHQPGLLLASGQMHDGRVTAISLHSQREKTVTLDVPGYTRLSYTQREEKHIVPLPLTITLHAGQLLEGTPLP